MEDKKHEHHTAVKFMCPKCGEVAQDDVIFLCNVCPQSDLVKMDGIYMCPSCLKPGENFQCMICDSKEVKMVKEASEEKHSRSK